MGNVALQLNEHRRLISLYDYKILDTERIAELDHITKFTAKLFRMPMSLITIIDKERQWFKSTYGIDILETPRDIAFCDYTIQKEEVFEVPDSHADERFKDNPLVTGFPNIRYYCGAPLINEAGFSMGSLAVLNNVPDQLNDEQKEILVLLAKQVVNFFELEYSRQQLQKKVEEKTYALKQKIEELEAREKELRKRNEELDSFIYAASHDLKAPISNIEGLLRYLEETIEMKNKDEEILKIFDLMNVSIEKFKTTIYDLTEISQIQKTNGKEIQENKFSEVLDDVMVNIKEMIDYSKVTIITDFRDCEIVKFPRKDLRSILFNLLSNSIKYRSPLRMPEVLLKSKDLGNEILLTVQDNGLGMRKEDVSKIFSMFKRLHSHVQGTGIGLYLVSKLVENSGGRIEVESQLGLGSEFRIYFKKIKSESIDTQNI